MSQFNGLRDFCSHDVFYVIVQIFQENVHKKLSVPVQEL